MKLTYDEIIAAVQRCANGPNEGIITYITTDTRRLQPGCLFVPLKGANYDGHDFIAQAFEGGAAYALSSRQNDRSDNRIIYCHDTLEAYGAIAKAYKSKLACHCIAVTGSVGKTTTKEMLAAVLAQGFRVHATAGNLNNAIGLPATILNAPEDTELMVLEMGMNSPGEIATLSRIATPDAAVITNIGTSHIQNLGSREGIARAKLEVLEGMADGTTIALNGDEPLLCRPNGYSRHKTLYFGIQNKDCDLVATDINMTEQGSTFTATSQGVASAGFIVPVAGTHNIYNALAAIAMGRLMGLSDSQIQCGLSSFKPTPGRQNIIDADGITYIEDCYNASPESMLASLEVMRLAKCTGRRIAVLGDMLELGDYAEEGHRRVGKALSEKGVDLLYCYGPQSATLVNEALKKLGSENCFHFIEKNDMIEAFLPVPVKGDMILFKASRGMKMEEVIQALDAYRGRSS